MVTDRLIRHAQLYGVADVYETAEAERLAPEELGRLAARLRRINPQWRLTREQTDRLLDGLIAVEMPDRRILEMAGISRPTLRRAHSRAADRERSGPPQATGRIAATFRREAA